MKEDLSALFDGEIGSEELEPLLERLCSDKELQREWEMYCLLQSMTRRQCTHAYFNSVLAEATQHETDNIHKIKKKPTQPKRFFTNWNFGLTSLGFKQGAYKLAASVGVAALVGFFVGITVQDRFFDTNPLVQETALIDQTPTKQFQSDTIASIDDSTATRWIFNDATATLDRERNLNKLLLEHSLAVPNTASNENFGPIAMLVSYDYQ